MMDNIPNFRLEVLIDYVLTKRNVCNPILTEFCCSCFSNRISWAFAEIIQGHIFFPKILLSSMLKFLK